MINKIAIPLADVIGEKGLEDYRADYENEIPYLDDTIGYMNVETKWLTDHLKETTGETLDEFLDEYTTDVTEGLLFKATLDEAVQSYGIEGLREVKIK